MINKIKTIFLVILSCLLLIPYVSAAPDVSPAFSSVTNDIEAKEPESKAEKKELCRATLDDDFADDSILVMYTKKESQKLVARSKQDFSEIEVKAVTDLTCSTRMLIKEKKAYLENKNTAAVQSFFDIEEDPTVLSTEITELEDTFNQVIEIKLNTKGKQNVLNSIKKLEKRDDLLVVQPNYTYSLCAIPNDPDVNEQWTIDLLNLKKAWDITTGSADVLVGVMDSGIERTHPDLAGRIDISASRDFTGNNQPFNDEADHGTDVAGVIGAIGNNNKGYTGVCWNIKMASLRISDASGQSKSSYMIQAIDHSRQKNISIINCSVGGYNMEGLDSILENEINNFPGLLICAAGNDGKDNDKSPVYPASFNCLNIISVGGSGHDDRPGAEPGWATNYGKTSVDLFAPAVDICTTSTWEGYTTDFGATSSAAPHVTGVTALIKSKYPDLSASRIKNLILNGVDKNSSLTSKCVTGGRLNAYNALKTTSSYFTVTYNANGGSGIMTDTRVYYGEPTNIRKNTFTRSGYDFDCWYIKRSSDGKWRYINPNNASQSEWYTEGKQPSGWVKYRYDNGISISKTVSNSGEVVTFYAQWKKYFTIRYNANGGSGSMADTKVTYGVSTKLRPNTFTRSGYDFDCWYIKRSSDGKWRYINPNNASQSEWYTEGKQPSGWVKYRYDNGISVAYTVSNPGEVVTFYAQWKKYFIIRYNANGGSGSMADTKVTYGVSTKLRSNTFTRSGYKFDCWYIKRSSDGKWRYINPNNASQSEWYTEGKQPSGWVKYRYDNGISVAYTVSNPGEVVTFYAQWK